MAELFTPRTLPEHRDNNASIFRKHLGASFDVNDPNSIVGAIVETLSLAQFDAEKAIERMGRTIHPAFASGAQLDALAAGVDVFRSQITAASGTIQLLYPVGTGPGSFLGETLTRTDGVTYRVNQSSRFGPFTGLNFHFYYLGVVCEQVGPIGNIAGRGAVANGLLSFDNTFTFATSATSAFVGGSNRETDEEFRLRYFAAIRNASTGGNVADWERWALEDRALCERKR